MSDTRNEAANDTGPAVEARRFDGDSGEGEREGADASRQAQAEPVTTAEAVSEVAEPGVEQPDPRDLELASMRDELSAARRRVDELARAYQALDRDREEFKQRLTRERERLIDVERGQAASILLDAVDELDLCLMAAGTESSPLAQGVRLIREGLLKKLDAAGVQRLELEGLPFDPGLAEAADMELTTNPDEDQRVLGVMRAGYKLKERVIRPARVKVARYVKPADA